MSKKKKKKWWETGFTWKQDVDKVEINNEDGTKTTLPTSKGKPKQRRLFDEDGIEVTDYYDDYYYEDYYQNDWGRNLEQKKGGFTSSKKDYDTSYSNYEKTGYWGGYNVRVATLSYKYVQQMANALASQYKITLEVGNTWEVDLKKKKLKYNPSSLIYGTKSELLATLLHEIGKLCYMEHYTTLDNKYLEMYKEIAGEAFVPFEDVRVDYQILKAYESAGELYESAIPNIQKQIQNYYKYGDTYRKITVDILQRHYADYVLNPVQDPEEQKMRLLQSFGTYDISKVEERMNELSQRAKNNGSIFEYCGDMLISMYDIDMKDSGLANIKQKIDLTFKAVEPIKKQLTSQGAVDIMDIDVFPHIEDLLKDAKDKKDEIQNMFPEMPEQVAKAIADEIKRVMRNFMGMKSNTSDKDANPTPNSDSLEIRGGGSGPSEVNIPPEWVEGDYKSLKESVEQEIKTLVHKLTFIRREEMTVKYSANQKRGKLNTRSLVKHAFGNRRLFKQKLENVDTIQSFAFSILMDISGSMDGRRIIHTTRAMVLFNEVFKKLNIPFELVVFNDGATHIKKFDEDSTKEKEKEIGGLVDASRGGTNLNRGLDGLTIQKRPESNKVVIVLTDGGVGDADYYNKEYFAKWREKYNIKSLAFGLELSNSEYRGLEKLCEGNGKVIENASQLPIEFTNLLKNLIKRKK